MMLQFIFIIITLLSFFLFWYGTGKDRRVLLLSTGWIAITGIGSYYGYFENTLAMPPRFLIVIAGAIGLSLFFYKIIDRSKLNLYFLTAVHILRLPIELTFYQLFLQKQVPVLMTFRGWNFDIIMGISAIFFLLYLSRKSRKSFRAFYRIWNIAGLIFLAVIVLIAIFSSPLPVQQLAFDQPNVAVLKFPFIYLPAYIVPVVCLSHILAIKSK